MKSTPIPTSIQPAESPRARALLSRPGLRLAALALAFVLLLLAPARAARAVEPWADDRLAVRDRLELWFDASRQNAARGALGLPPLASSDGVDFLPDASGRGRHLRQPFNGRRPRYKQEFYGAFLAFDGNDDALTATGWRGHFQGVTVFAVLSPRSNSGGFRGICSLARAGRNDYTSGLNLDLGSAGSSRLTFLNAEGAGFTGEQNLFAGPPTDFGAWSLLTLRVEPGKEGVRLFINGRPAGARDRSPEAVEVEDFVLGARLYSNNPEAPYVQGYFHGDLAEFLLYGAALDETNRLAVEKYLGEKHGMLLRREPETTAQDAPLRTDPNPPPVQMFRPGFTARELPLALPNINNLRYRPDGKLVALGYNGAIYLLSATNQGALENHASTFWEAGSLRAPIGMALTPPGYALGQGVFVASKGKVSLVVDTNGDDRADREIIVAEGWKELSHGVDALGVAIDRENNLYFGLGTTSFTGPYLVDKATGDSRYSLQSERGTILKVSPDFKHREIICTGIRFPVGMAFNQAGDLFCTDQEGATWLPNGNPFDELLWIRSGRHYGFPPRHPRYLPDVIDEPSLFDFAPQHQSTCGLFFNEPVNGGAVFGPEFWRGNALVCGYSRGKIWRTALAMTPSGYVARAEQIASLPLLVVDACVSPAGDLVVATHGGEPDWGSGPNGAGRLFKISRAQTNAPQPVLTWVGGPGEIDIAFDRPLDPSTLHNLATRARVTQGRYVSAGDRFETKRPGYAAVYRQLAEPRRAIPVLGALLTPDRRSLILQTAPLASPFNLALTLADFDTTTTPSPGAPPQRPNLDLAADLSGLEARWNSADRAQPGWSGWLPLADLAAARAFTTGSASHEALWPLLEKPGELTLKGQLNLYEMLQPAIQPGSLLDYERPSENVTVVFTADRPFVLVSGAERQAATKQDGRFQGTLTRPGAEDAWIPYELSLGTGPGGASLSCSWITAKDSRPRPMQLRRFLVPWARPSNGPAPAPAELSRPELAGGNWLRGRRLFFGPDASCSKCHIIRGEGNRVGPDLSNLPQRDYTSVLKDIAQPSAALNPDHLAYNIDLADGDTLTAVLQTETRDAITVADASGKSITLPRARVNAMRASSISLMPDGLDRALGPERLKDLMTFLLTEPLEPAPIVINGAPAPRSIEDLAAAFPPQAAGPAAEVRPLRVLLCAGPKDHGASEHDYPLWQKRWSKLLALAENTRVSEAWEWPSEAQWRETDVVVFYSDNPGWNKDRAARLSSFIEAGGGAVFLHFAVDGHNDVEALAKITGLAWRGGVSKFRHGALKLKLEPGPLADGLDSPAFMDESYWNLIGSLEGSRLVGSAVEEGEARPLLWTREQGRGRVFVSIPGHYVWTFDDPCFRLLVLRGISWAAGQPVNRLSELAAIGARVGTK